MDFYDELGAYAERMNGDLAARQGGTELCAPAHRIWIDGQERRDVAFDVVGLELRDSLEELSGVSLVLKNWHDDDPRAEARFKYSRDPGAVALGKRLELFLGYRDHPGLMRAFVGEITALDPCFPAGAGTTMVVRALDRLHRLRNRPHSRAWKEKTDADIARAIAVENHFGDPVIDPTGERYALVPQHNRDDLAFLVERARRIDFEVQVRNDVLYFIRPRETEPPRLRLSWTKHILSFYPSMTLARQVSKVTVRGYHPTRGEVIVAGAGKSKLDALSRGRKSAVEVLDQALGEPKEEVIVTEAVTSEADAAALAEAALLENSYGFITGRAETIGIPALRAGTTVGIDGFGDAFDGDYYITASTHRIDTRGYRTMISVRKAYAS